MLRCYTLGRADEAAIDEVLAVEEQVFPLAPQLNHATAPRSVNNWIMRLQCSRWALEDLFLVP